MTLSLRIHRNIRFCAVVAGVIAFGVMSVQLVDHALAKQSEEIVPKDGNRLVQIHDRGQERTVVTSAHTVRDALKAADVTIDENHDVVEPSLDAELISKKYQVNIYRARPVTVVDGARRVRVTTAHQTPSLIAQAAGMTLYPEDKTDVTAVDNIVMDGADSVVTVTRAKLVKMTLYGKTSEVRTMARTVGDVLTEKQVVLGEQDALSVDSSTPIVSGMSIEVWRNGKQTITVEEDVDFPTETVRDANRPTTHREVKEAGEKGRQNVTYEIDMQNGKEVSRRKIAAVVIKEPKKQVEIIGTKSEEAQYTGGGSKDEWLAQSGISREKWGYVDAIIRRESGWNPNATNRSSGACGLAQALPCSKVPGGGYNPVNALRWADSYVNGRYYHGSPYLRGANANVCANASRGWQCAYEFWQRNHWY